MVSMKVIVGVMVLVVNIGFRIVIVVLHLVLVMDFEM
jgi:hypothetical protein